MRGGSHKGSEGEFYTLVRSWCRLCGGASATVFWREAIRRIPAKLSSPQPRMRAAAQWPLSIITTGQSYVNTRCGQVGVIWAATPIVDLEGADSRHFPPSLFPQKGQAEGNQREHQKLTKAAEMP